MRKIFAYLTLSLWLCINIINNVSVTKYKFPPKNSEYTYILDTGHGYRDTTCSYKCVQDENGRYFYEWILNWNVRNHLAMSLDSLGISYIFVNEDTFDLPLNDRVFKINKIVDSNPNKKFILFSIHANASNLEKDRLGKAEGYEVYIPKNNSKVKSPYLDKLKISKNLAIKYKNSVVGRNLTFRGIKEKNYTIISKTKCYSILTENNFFTNPQQRKKMRSEVTQKEIANFHLDIIKKLENK